MKFAHFIFCGVAALALPAAATPKEGVRAAPVAETTSSSTLFPGALDIPVADGSNVPANCEFPASLTESGLDLACIVADGVTEDEVGIEYISWLGENGFRHSANIIGGFAAARETGNGCEQTLNIYPHGEEGQTTGIWFALEREPQCTAAQPETP